MLKWWNPFGKKQLPKGSEEEFLRNLTLYEAWRSLARSASWSLIREEVSEQVRNAMGSLASGGLSPEAYGQLSGRTEALLWIALLPETRAAHYHELAEVARPQVIAPERDGPIQEDDL